MHCTNISKVARYNNNLCPFHLSKTHPAASAVVYPSDWASDLAAAAFAVRVVGMPFPSVLLPPTLSEASVAFPNYMKEFGYGNRFEVEFQSNIDTRGFFYTNMRKKLSGQNGAR